MYTDSGVSSLSPQVVSWLLLGAVGHNIVHNALNVTLERAQEYGGKGVATTECEVFAQLRNTLPLSKVSSHLIEHVIGSLKFLSEVSAYCSSLLLIM